MRHLLAFMVAPIVGLAAFTGRFLFSWPEPLTPMSFLRVFSHAAEKVALPEVSLLVLGGVFLGVISGPAPRLNRRKTFMPVVLAATSVALFPILSLLDLHLGASGSSHNLLLIEWCFYAVDGLFVLAGICIVR